MQEKSFQCIFERHQQSSQQDNGTAQVNWERSWRHCCLGQRGWPWQTRRTVKKCSYYLSHTIRPHLDLISSGLSALCLVAATANCVAFHSAHPITARSVQMKWGQMRWVTYEHSLTQLQERGDSSSSSSNWGRASTNVDVAQCITDANTRINFDK